MKNKKYIILIIVVIVTISLFFLNKEEENTENNQRVKTEKSENKKSDNIIKISQLKNSHDPILLYGKVTSDAQVNVFAEVPAKITKVNAKLGDYVKAGDIVVILESKNEVNALSQAKLNLNSAKLNLEKLLAGSRDEEIKNAEADSEIKQGNLEKTKNDILKNIDDLKISLEAVLRKDIDDFFDHTDKNKSPYLPTFTYRLRSKTKIEKLENSRTSLQEKFDSFLKNEENISLDERVDSAILITQDFSDMAQMLYENSRDFIGFSDTELETFETNTSAIKTKIDGYKITLETLKNTRENQEFALEISSNTLNIVTEGARDEDIKVSKSRVDIAQNSVNSANIALSKKILKAPIDGKISYISAKIGKLALGSSPVFSIHNPNNLKVESSISSNYSENIFTGKDILVEDFSAKISAVSPVIDEKTGSLNFEAFLITDQYTEEKNIFSGKIVKINIEKEFNKKQNLSIPISAIIEEDEKYFIFKLNSKSEAEKVEVDFVKISGQNIIIKNKFTGKENIIINTRGISEGDKI